jgi:hypothetical protein
MQVNDAAARTLIARAEGAFHGGVDLSDDWTKLLLERRMGKHGAFQQLLDNQLRFRIVGEGHFLDRVVLGDSPISQTVAGRPEVQQAIHGAMATIDAARGAKQLEGMTFSYDDAGWIANRAVQAMVGKEASLANYRQAVGEATTHVLGYSAVRAGNWIHMGPEKSRPFIEFFRGDRSPETVEGLSRSIKTLLHEIAHIVTPRARNERNLRWMSEGIAETWARWPGNVEAAGRRMGTPTLPDFHRVLNLENEKYPDQVRTLRALLQLAGVDTNDPAAISQFEELCQVVGVSKVPRMLAERIDERFAGISRTEVLHMIEGLSPNETDVNVQPVLDLARRAGQQLDLPG